MSSYYIYKPEHRRDYKLLSENIELIFTDLWDLVEFLLRKEGQLYEKNTIQEVER